MARKKIEKGECRLCGIFQDLRYEHVPPRIAFNKNTKFKSESYLNYIKANNPLNYKISGPTKQGGIGYYSLCRTCNSFLGTNYVNAYANWVLAISDIARREHNHFVFSINNLEPLRILKQILSMFLSINPEGFGKANIELSDFIKNPESNILPDKFRLFIYLNTEGSLRYLPVTSKAKISTQQVITLSEIAFPPLGYVLTFGNDNKANCLFEITHFKDFKLSDIVEIDFGMYKLPTYLPIPLDYRQKSVIEKNIQSASR